MKQHVEIFRLIPDYKLYTLWIEVHIMTVLFQAKVWLIQNTNKQKTLHEIVLNKCKCYFGIPLHCFNITTKFKHQTTKLVTNGMSPHRNIICPQKVTLSVSVTLWQLVTQCPTFQVKDSRNPCQLELNSIQCDNVKTTHCKYPQNTDVLLKFVPKT